MPLHSHSRGCKPTAAVMVWSHGSQPGMQRKAATTAHHGAQHVERLGHAVNHAVAAPDHACIAIAQMGVQQIRAAVEAAACHALKTAAVHAGHSKEER